MPGGDLLVQFVKSSSSVLLGMFWEPCFGSKREMTLRLDHISQGQAARRFGGSSDSPNDTTKYKLYCSIDQINLYTNTQTLAVKVIKERIASCRKK